ncbi:HAD hydrolase-like protein [Candidatus Uhrbacteria bacterium]|nr:HAD hydrolase-like protein [Candidatus Uhrbacteria bacterium]
MSGLFEEQASRPELSPRAKRQRWANNLRQVTDGAIEASGDEVYQALQELRIRSPHLEDELDYHLEVNERLIRRFSPSHADREHAQELRRLLRLDNPDFTIYKDVRELTRWVVQELGSPIYVVSGHEDRRLRRMLHRWKKIRGRITDMITTESVGYDKVRPEFWREVLRRVGVSPGQFVMIGSNIITDTFATTAGVPVIVRDRDWFQRQLAHALFDGEFRGAPILDVVEGMPPRRAFIGLAQKTDHIKHWLMRIRDARLPAVGSQVG